MGIDDCVAKLTLYCMYSVHSMNNQPHLHAKRALEIYNYPAVQDDLYVIGHAIAAGLISYKKMTILLW